MGSLCSSLFGSQASTSYQAPEEIKSAITDILGRAAKQSNAPYPQYSPATAAQYQNYNAGLLAPLSPDQAQAGQTISGLQGGTQPMFQQAAQMVNNAASPLQMQQFNQQNVNRYMNPYLNDVVNSAVSNINQTNAQQQQQVLGNAIQKGAFGGDRAGIAQAELARQQNLSNNATISNLLNQGYTQAQGQFNNQQQTDLATQLQNRNLQSTNAINLANFATQGQQAALQQAQAQYGYGTAEQQQRQAQLSTAYQQYMNQQAFPYQQLSYYAGLASGAAPALGGTTTGYSPTYSPYNALQSVGTLGTIIGGGGGTGGLFGTASNAASALAPFALFNTGGRVGYATGGSPTSSSIVDAYTKYQQLVASHAPKPILDQAYQDYQKAFYGATAPYDDATVAAVKPAPTTTSTTTTTPTDTNRDGGGNARENAGNGFVDSSSGVKGIPGLTASGGIGPAGYSLGLAEAGKKAPEGLMSQLKGGTDPVTGVQTGIMGAFDALAHGNSAGTINQVGMRTNMVADPSQGGRGMPNTTSGMTAQEFADKFNLDLSQVRAGIVNGQVEFFKDTPIGNFLHGSSVPAINLDKSLLGKPTSTEDTSIESADLSAKKSPEAISSYSPTGVVGSNKTGFSDAYNKAAFDAEQQGKLSPGTIAGIVAGESSYNPNAKNGKSLGLGQFQPGTAAAYDVDPTDPTSSIAGIGKYAGDLKAGLSNPQGLGIDAPTKGMIGAAYNQGLQGFEKIARADENSLARDVVKNFANNKFGVSDDATVADWKNAAYAAYEKNAIAPKNPGDYANPGNTPTGVVNRNDPTTIGNGQGNISGITNPADPTTIGNGQGNITGVGPDTSQNSDKAIAEQDAKEQAARDQAKAEADTQVGDARTSDPSAAEKRGGRIHPHHYAAGGYAPINMMYGMPTSEDISQIATDEAGSGAGVLSPQLAALAANGVIPSAKGGRIGYGDPQPGGAVVAQDDTNPVDQTGLHWWDAGYDPTKHPEVAERLNKNAQKDADIAKMPVYQRVIGEGVKSVADLLSSGASGAQSVIDYINSPSGKVDPSTVTPKKTVKTDVPAAKPIPGSGKPSTYVPDWAKEGYDPEAAGKAQTLTQPIIPKNDVYDSAESAMPSKIPSAKVGYVADDGLDQVSAEKPSVNNQPVAPRVSPTRDVAPGIKQWYNAPAPVDRDYMARLAFFGAGSRPGATLGDSVSAYQDALLANQGQERSTMRNEADSAHVRAQAGYTGAQEANEHLKQYGLGYALVQGTGGPGNEIEMTLLPTLEEGQTISGQGALQNGKPLQMGTNVVATGKNAYNGQTYGLETDKTGSNQDIHNQIVQLGAAAKKNNMPVDRASAVENQKNMNTIVSNLNEQADVANQQLTANNEITKAIHSYSHLGPRSPGFAGQTKAQVINAMTSSANTLFGIDLGLNQYSSDQDIINKMRIVAANTGSDSRAAKWIEQYANALPGVGLNADAIKTLVSNMYVDRFRKNNLAQFADAYNTASAGQARDIGTAFTRITGNEPQKYTDLQNAIVKLLKTHQPEVDPETGKPKVDPKTGKPTGEWQMNPRTQHYETPISSFLQGDMTAEEFNKEAYKHTGIKNMAAVFGGGK